MVGASFDLRAEAELAWGLLGRELRARYRGSVLGLAWSLLHPLLMLSIYAWVFTQVFRVGVPRHLELMVAGLFPWTAFAAGLSAAAGSVVGRADLVRKVPFQQALLPVVAVAVHAVQWLLAMPIVVAFLAWRGCWPHWAWLAWPALVLPQLLWTLGLGLALACLAVRFRDVEPLLGVALAAAFYLVPVVYPPSLVPAPWRGWYLAQPMAGLVDAHQGLLMHGLWPSWGSYLGWWVAALVALALGAWAFAREAPRFAERL